MNAECGRTKPLVTELQMLGSMTERPTVGVQKVKCLGTPPACSVRAWPN